MFGTDGQKPSIIFLTHFYIRASIQVQWFSFFPPHIMKRFDADSKTSERQSYRLDCSRWSCPSVTDVLSHRPERQSPMKF